MEALNALIAKADSRHLFVDLGVPELQNRPSFYADDLVVFLSPRTQDFVLINAILDAFAAASGLYTNLSKCHLLPIRCRVEELLPICSFFPYQVTPFLVKYLGIPLSLRKLRKCDV